MSVKIRLARGGSKKKPFYRLVVADSARSRDGKFIEKVGTYNPMLPKDSEERVNLVKERIEYWLGQGAIPSERIALFLQKAEIGQELTSVKKVNAKIAQSRAVIEARVAAEKKAKEAEEAAKAKEEAEAAKAAAKEAKEAEKAAAEEAKAEEKSEDAA